MNHHHPPSRYLKIMNITGVLALILLPLFFVPKFVSTMKEFNFLVLFFFINLIFLAIWLGGLKSSVHNCDSFSYLPPLVLEEEYYQLPEESKDEDCDMGDNEDFLPCSVFVEYKKEEPLLLEYSDHDDGDGFHGYDGYEEDDDDDGGGDDEDESDEDLKRRFEEFIAKTKKKWKEESHNDKLLRIAAAT